MNRELIEQNITEQNRRREEEESRDMHIREEESRWEGSPSR